VITGSILFVGTSLNVAAAVAAAAANTVPVAEGNDNVFVRSSSSSSRRW